MNLRNLIFLLPLILVTGCHQVKNEKYNRHNDIPEGNLYAEKFIQESYEGMTILTVNSPWQKAGESTFRYILLEEEKTLPDSLSDIPVIRTPVDKVVIMSTTFLPFIDTLDGLRTIKGVSGADNFFQSEVKEQAEKGNIRDVGFDQMLNYELLLDIQPDVVFMFGVQPGVMKHVEKLEEFGISVVLVADYLEPHPLGRAEWIRFFSSFYNREGKADQIYKDIVGNYESVKSSAYNANHKPKVMIGLPWKDTWHIPQGNSFAAKLIEDAGGVYIWSDIEGTEAVAMDIEKVFFRAMEADVWINAGSAKNMRMLLEQDPRFSKLPAYKNGKIFNNNKRLGGNGGNDYWESGPLRPDIILEDLRKIFSQGINHENDTYYYMKLD